MKPASPFRRDFTLMVIGQIISLFGNAILRFSLSLHVLSLTGSAAVFGSILALAMVPTVLLSPLGGVLADRLPRQRIMVALDFLTCGLILCFDLFFARSGSLGAITAFLILLSLIQAVYQPSVQASIPSLAAEEALMAANGVVVQVQALSGLLGPILGGVLYAAFGLYPLLAGSALCFFASAVLELFLRIPFTPLARTSAPPGPAQAGPGRHPPLSLPGQPAALEAAGGGGGHQSVSLFSVHGGPALFGQGPSEPQRFALRVCRGGHGHGLHPGRAAVLYPAGPPGL